VWPLERDHGKRVGVEKQFGTGRFAMIDAGIQGKSNELTVRRWPRFLKSRIRVIHVNQRLNYKKIEIKDN